MVAAPNYLPEQSFQLFLQGATMIRLNTRSLSILSLCLFAVASAPTLAAGAAYTLDPGHTQVEFHWNHVGFSHPGAGFNEISGKLIWNTADPSTSSVTVDIPVASIDSHVPALDQKLKSAEFFDAAKFPKITFVSTKVERTEVPGKWKVTGNLTLHGVTKPVVLETTLNKAGTYPMLKIPALGFDATTRFKRSDFGVSVGVPMVGDEIEVRITVEALEAEGYARAMGRMKATPPSKPQK
jgi:polyisoprenoid-binding protein YceI